jgi:dTDP-4-amino-4,6-dideoxygalactose transaminase
MNNYEKVPFLDLVSPHLELEEELVAVFRSAIRSGRFIGGTEVEEFEREFARYCEVDCCVGVGSGTDALRFALTATGVNMGEMVLTVPNTFIATTEAITQVGAAIGFIDIDERTYNMDPAKLKEYLETRCTFDKASGRPVDIATGRTVSAVIPVHLYGQMADMDPIMRLAEEYNLIVVEDACQAHGAEYLSRGKGRLGRAGSIGRSGAFSFYPGKNLGACGEGGAVTTNDPDIAKKVRMLRDHGQIKKYYHDIEGYNGRLDAVQAGILRVKLRHLGSWNEDRRQIAIQYNQLLCGLDGITLPYEPEWSNAVYHLYVIRTEQRDALQAFLAQQGITTGLHYPIPLHLQKAYEPADKWQGGLSVSERVSRQILSLPMFPGLTTSQQQRVADGIKQCLLQSV